MQPHPLSFYAREVRAELPPDAFEPVRARMLWLPFHLAVIVVSTLTIAVRPAWPFMIGLALVIGHSFACITFLAHEAMHGSLTRNRTLRGVIGFLGFLPFTLSPRLWVAWHNKAHHGHTMREGLDPDAYPTLDKYQSDGQSRFVADRLAPGRGHIWGGLAMFVVFSLHGLNMALSARRYNFLSEREHRIALAEKALGIGLWVALAVAIGFVPFIFAYLLPLLLANLLVLAFIETNHSLSPLTVINDPLLNSLSVTVPAAVAFMSLNFGYHVEHHVFPYMSPRHAPRVRDILVARWPERYQSMPLWRALVKILATGRVYKSPTMLCDPRTGREWPALRPIVDAG